MAALGALLVAACSSPLAPNGPLTGTWVYHGADSSTDYYDLILTQAGTAVQGRYELCQPTLCAFGTLSARYQDSSFSYQFGNFSVTAQPSFTGRLQTIDTLVGVLTNFAQISTDTFVFVRTNVVIPEPIVPGLSN